MGGRSSNPGGIVLPPGFDKPVQVVQQLTPFNDVQTVAWIAAQIQSTSMKRVSECVSDAQDILVEAFRARHRFDAELRKLQEAEKAAAAAPD